MGELSPKNIGISWERANSIDRGHDSEVRGLGKSVIKRYPDLDIDTLLNYQRLTQNASGIITGRQILTPMGNARLSINPISQVLEDPNNFDVYTVSPRIVGINPQRVFQNEALDMEFRLEEVSGDLVKALGHRGLHIIPYNTMLVGKGGNLNLVVTDIAKRVSDISRI
jgi:hypothetical protein